MIRNRIFTLFVVCMSEKSNQDIYTYMRWLILLGVQLPLHYIASQYDTYWKILPSYSIQ